MRTVFVGALALTALAGSALADITANANLLANMPMGSPVLGTEAVTPGATYSDWTNFTGSAMANGGAALVGGAYTTKYVSEQINRTNAGSVNRFGFSVANFGALPISARARVRFHDLTNGGGTNSGGLLTGYTFSLISFAPGVSLFYANIAAIALPQNFSIGITFDNVGSLATQADMNMLGVGIFDPPDVGSSPDLAFATTAAHSGFAANIPGASFNFGGNPIANFGWEIVPAPSAMALLGLGGLMAARRRR